MMTLAAPQTDEHRVALRRRALIAATIRYRGGAVTVECVVRNISDTGAKLDVSEGVALPSSFELVIPQKDVVHRCELRWRRAGEAGVAFVDAGETAGGDPHDAASDGHAPARPSDETFKARIRNLEAEIVRLRARIAELGGS